MEFGRFPNRLKKYRRIAGYSQKKVAKLLGLSDTSMLSRWEHGCSAPKLEQLFKLSRLYNAFPQELYCELWNSISESPLLAHSEPVTTQEIFYQ